MKKYEFTGETMKFDCGEEGVILHRIKAVRSFGEVQAGEQGGWIEKEENLSHDGECWVSSEAIVCNNAKVVGDARVSGHALVKDNAQIGLKHRDAIGAKLASGLLEQCSFPEDSLTPVFEMDAFGSGESDSKRRSSHTSTRKYARVMHRTTVCGNAKICDLAEVRGSATVKGNALVLDESSVKGDAIIEGDVVIRHKAAVGGTAHISGTCAISGDTKIASLPQTMSIETK